MNDFSMLIKNLPVKETVLCAIKKRKEIYLILSKRNFLEILKIDPFQKFKCISVSNFFWKIYKIIDVPTYFGLISYLILIDNYQTINLVKINGFFEFKITSSINLVGKFLKSNFQSLFLIWLKKSSFFLLGTTWGLKIVVKIGKDRKNNLKFLKKGLKITQKKLICYFLANSGNSSDKIFFSIESLIFLPYSRYLVCYRYSNSRKIKKNVFSRINCTSYLIIPILNNTTGTKNIIILSKGKLSIIDCLQKRQLVESFPLKKFNRKYLQIYIISFCFFRGKTKTIYFFLNKEGDVFTFNIDTNLSRNRKRKVGIKYFDSLSDKSKSIKIFPGGIFFSNLKKGDICLYRFIKMRNSRYDTKGFFVFRRKLKNLVLINEVCLISNISSIVNYNILDLSSNKFLFFCNTKDRSSLRFLHKICNIYSIFKKSFVYKPLGIFIVKESSGIIYFFVSFKFSTLSFSFGKKMEETNQFRILTDCKTILMKYCEHFRMIVQVSPRSLRLIKITREYKKICHWLPSENVFILNSKKNEYGWPYLFVLLSNYKIVLIEFTKNGGLLELKSWSIDKFTRDSLLLNCYISNNSNLFKFLIIGTNRERTLRIFKIFGDFSIILANVQLLEWSPESISIIKKEASVFLCIGLNNGILLRSTLCVKSGKIKIIDFLNLSKFPLYFPDNFSFSYLFIFGEKIWLIKNNRWNVSETKVIYENSFDLIEPMGKFLFVLSDYELKIVLNVKKKTFKLNRLGFFFHFASIDSYSLTKFKKKFILAINKTKTCFFPGDTSNQNLREHEKNLDIMYSTYRQQNCSSNICILAVSENFLGDDLENFRQFDTLDFSDSSGNYFLKTILKKKATGKNRYIFLISKILKNSVFGKKGLISTIQENYNQSASLMLFSSKKNLKFCSNSGGKYIQCIKINFIYEKNLNVHQSNFKNNFLTKILFGNRILINLRKTINLLEIGKDTFNIFYVINFPTIHLVKLKIEGNRIYALEKFRGFKVFVFTKKKKILGGINLLDNFLLEDFFVLNPVTIIVIDVFKNPFVFKLFENDKKKFSQKKWKILNVNLLSKFEGYNTKSRSLIKEIFEKISLKDHQKHLLWV